MQQETSRAHASRFRFVEEIGVAAASRLHRAIETRTGRTVLVEVALQGCAHGLAEARSCGEVAHPALLPTLEIVPDETPSGVLVIHPDADTQPLAAALKTGGALPPKEALRLSAALAGFLQEARATLGDGVAIDPRDVLLGADNQLRVLGFRAASFSTPANALALGGVGQVLFSLVCGSLVTGLESGRELRRRLPPSVPEPLRQLLDACLGIGAEPPPSSIEEFVHWLGAVERILASAGDPDRAAVAGLRDSVEQGTATLRESLELARRIGVERTDLPDREALAAALLPAQLVDAGQEPAVARRALEGVTLKLREALGTLDRSLQLTLKQSLKKLSGEARRLYDLGETLLRADIAVRLGGAEQLLRAELEAVQFVRAAEALRGFELSLEAARMAVEQQLRAGLAGLVDRAVAVIEQLEKQGSSLPIPDELEPVQLRANGEQRLSVGEYEGVAAFLQESSGRLESMLVKRSRLAAAALTRAKGAAAGRDGPARPVWGFGTREPTLAPAQLDQLRSVLAGLPFDARALSPAASLRVEGERLLETIDQQRARIVAPELVERLGTLEREAYAAAGRGDDQGALLQLVRSIDTLRCLAEVLNRDETPGDETLPAAGGLDLSLDSGAVILDAGIRCIEGGESALGGGASVSEGGVLALPGGGSVWERGGSLAAGVKDPLGGLAGRVKSSGETRGAPPDSRCDETGMKGRNQGAARGAAAYAAASGDAASAAARLAPRSGVVPRPLSGEIAWQRAQPLVLVLLLLGAALLVVHVSRNRSLTNLVENASPIRGRPLPSILGAWPAVERVRAPRHQSWVFSLMLDGPADPVFGPHWAIDGSALGVSGATLQIAALDRERPGQPFLLTASLGIGIGPGRHRSWWVEPFGSSEPVLGKGSDLRRPSRPRA